MFAEGDLREPAFSSKHPAAFREVSFPHPIGTGLALGYWPPIHGHLPPDILLFRIPLPGSRIPMTYFEFTEQFEVRVPLAQAWEFFSRPEFLRDITPQWMGMRVTSPAPLIMGDGKQIDYRMGWLGLPLHWRSYIIEFQPPHRLSYVQVRGPYSQWLHQHAFWETSRGTTACFDRAVYRLPLGPIGVLTHRLLVKRQILEIFRTRRQRVARRLGPLRNLQRPRIQRL